MYLQSSPSSSNSLLKFLVTTELLSFNTSANPQQHNMGGTIEASGLSVADALEIARDSPEGAEDPAVVSILESAITEIWGKVEAAPDTYVMTRDEFAIFNYFQGRFEGNPIAISAIKRYWDRLEQTNGA